MALGQVAGDVDMVLEHGYVEPDAAGHRGQASQSATSTLPAAGVAA